MNKTAAILASIGGAALGGAVMYFTDPERGHGRRTFMRDKMTGTWKGATEVMGKRGHDVAGRARGMAEAAKSSVRRSMMKAADEKLAKRVRSRIGHAVSNPGAIDVSVEEGRVTLSGSVLADEAGDLIREASRVRGVEEVEHRLHVYRTAEHAPELQGGAKRGMSPALRAVMGVTGGALTVYGMRRRSDAVGRAARVVGAGLLSRGVVSEKLRRMIGRAA